MQKKYFLLLFLLATFLPLKAQLQLSSNAEVSIITAGPGKELYEAFGHSAIRINDPVLNLDLIYNYGIFDFNQPNFYANFAKGNMIYSLASYEFKYFLASYKKDKRWVKQQVLNLTQEEKQAYFIFLENNALPKNTNYQYDPYFNNCATKLRDITKSILKNKVVFNDEHLEKKQSFRQLTNNEIHWNSWGTFGLNLIAGIKLDEKATSEEYMYLPDYVYRFFKNGHIFIKNQPEKLIKREDVLLDFEEQQPIVTDFSPFLIFNLLALWGMFITYKDIKNKKRTKYLDFILLFMTGLLGAVLFFLWFFSSHATAPNNFNCLWAFAPNLIVAFLTLKHEQAQWLTYYYQLLAFLLLSIPILWFIEVQTFTITTIPMLILLFVRYLFLSKK